MDFSQLPPWYVLLLTGVAGAAQLGVILAVIVAAIRSWEETRAAWRPGLVLAGVAAAMAVPNRVVGAMYTDVSAMLPFLPTQDQEPIQALIVALPGMAFGVAIAVGLYAAHYALTLRLDSGQAHPFPALTGQAHPYRGWGIALVIGLGAGLLSTALFRLLEIEVGELMELAQDLTPGLDREAWWFSWLVVLPWTLTAAIQEELMFRGVVQRFLARWFGRGELGGWAAIVVTSLFWACLHAPNTTAMGFKLVQIFLLGLIFGALARKRGVEASIVAHMSLNLAATALELTL
jgi:membrane protease YdiL (CAAX protease family)